MNFKEQESFNLGQLAAYCYMVERGKPAAMIPIKKSQVKSAIKFVKEISELMVHTEEISDSDWQIFWVYKHPHILEVIKSLPRVPRTVFDHWVLGKLFGYDETSIQSYLKANQLG